jgi:hypothetical protein
VFKASRRLPPPEECANCGATIPATAKACPECGADERTGWREASVYDDLDLPESAWSDDDTKRRPDTPRVNGVPWYWWVIGVVLLVLLFTRLIALP